MKELVVIYGSAAEASSAVLDVLKEIEETTDIKVSRLDVDSDSAIVGYFEKKFNLQGFPVVLGFVDGEPTDGHYGQGSRMIFESLVG